MMRPAGKKPDRLLGRRQLLRSMGGLCLATACGPQPAATTAGTTAKASGAVEIWSWFDLPDDPRSRELSGIAWDAAAKTLWAVQDETANIVPIIPDAQLRSWTFGPMITLTMSFPLDLEGIALLPDGFIVSSEKGPRVLEVDRQGKLRRDIALPDHFAKARENKSLESLSMSPDRKWLFTTTEEALMVDGARATMTKGTRVRVLRMAWGTDEAASFPPRPGSSPSSALRAPEISEHAYATDPSPHEGGDYGIADLAALSADDLLVLERGWTRGYGNTARIYRTSLTDASSSCLAAPELAPEAPVMSKTLFADMAKLPAKGLPEARQKQDSPLLDNFEGLAVGPQLPDGRQAIIVVSDDNGRSDQYARIVVLAVG
jgi:3-phytase